MKQLKLILMTVLVLTGLGFADISYADNKVLLGERHVSDASEKDTIHVGVDRGKFNGLQVRVSGSTVEFKHTVIHFKNGTKQVIEKNRRIGAGDRSRVIDLDGGFRFIDRVVFTYEARSFGWKGADIKLFGVR